MATGSKREVTWCFMPSQPVWLYEGSEMCIRDSPKKIKKNEPFEQLKSTESLKIEKPQSEPKAKQQKTKYIKTALKGVNNGTPKDTKAKEQAQAEKSNK